MKLNPSELKQIVEFTPAQYERGADDFWEGTRDHNVGQNIAALLQYIYGEPPFSDLTPLSGIEGIRENMRT
jgi:hypothetical protein